MSAPNPVGAEDVSPVASLLLGGCRKCYISYVWHIIAIYTSEDQENVCVSFVFFSCILGCCR